MGKRTRSTLTTLFFRGVGVLLPFALTIYIVVWLWNFISGTFFDNVDDAIVWLIERLVQYRNGESLSQEALRQGVEEAFPPALRIWVSIALTIVILVLVGWWLSGFIGRRIVAAIDSIMKRVPLIGGIYPYVKQVTDFFFADERMVEFERVVAIPYPRRGLYSLGFLTGSSLRSLNEAMGTEMISVFVPSSPMPATGYTLFVPAVDIVPVKLSVDEALRTCISGGVLVADAENHAPSADALAAAARKKLADLEPEES